MSDAHARPRVLAVASGGGHWVQLMRLRPAFEGCDVTFVTVREQYRVDIPAGAAFEVVNDATRWNKFGLLMLAWRLYRIIRRTKPDAIITTGAAPGFFALRIGAFLGIRTAWVDSIANVEEVSLSGRRIGPKATLWLTQWPHLEKSCGQGPSYRGAVL
ncbi:MAG: UDP-N-acetylglucosamine--LPS N-acetylglucosamine transferase [Phycisphaerae bacterium]|nr:UDP-N-acetylglucosamine--LPS N-acetylglucosamine transferase [Phycisphaerae bacterium]